MTRTISKGEPPAPIARMYEIVCQAQDTAIAMVRPGVRGRDIHELVEDLIFEAGYDTARPGQRHSSGDAPLRGFTHGTGHGVGLEFTSRPASHVDALATCAWWQTMSSLWSQESMTPTSVA